MQVCRICLASKTKLYKIQEDIKEIFEQLTGLCVSPEDHLPHKVCWECAARLTASSHLRSKALHSHQLMMGLLHTVSYLSTKSLRTVDRDANGLNSTLSLKTYSPNHSDLHLHDVSPKTELVLEWDNTEELIEEIKVEHESDRLEFGDENSLSPKEEELVKHKSKKEKEDRKKKKKKSRAKEEAKDGLSGTTINLAMFSVTALSADEQRAALRRRSLAPGYARAPLKCELCCKGFLREDAYSHHAARHTDQMGPFVCDVCQLRFRTRHALRNHASAHACRLSCKRCAYVTTRQHAAKLHEEYHNGTRYQCPHCQDDFGKFSTYMSHIRMKHPSRFACALCGFSFVSAKGLALHAKLKHLLDERTIPADGPYCELCDVRFVADGALQTHLKVSLRHNLEREESVNKPKQPKGPPKRKRKDPSEQKPKRPAPCKPAGPIPCEQCDVQLPDALSYYRHFRHAHPDKNRTKYPSMKNTSMCEVCGKMFQSLALLQDHSWTHAGGARFACGVCHKRFVRAYRLRAHRRVHAAAPSPHVCRACPKRFSTASNLRRHMAIHSGVRPFKCEMCSKAFKHASEKRIHITYVHLKKPWPKRRGRRVAEGLQESTDQPMTTCESVSDIVQPLWPACSDPKIPDELIHGRQHYYNVKMQ